MRIPVLCAVPTADEAALVAALDARATGLQVVRRCADVHEVVALALAGLARGAVLAADLPGLDRAVVARLRGAGLGVVLLAAEHDVDRCRALAPDAALAVTAEPPEVVRAVQAAVGAGDAAEDGLGGAPGGSTPGTVVTASVDESEPEPVRGRLVAVWGPGGAPGRTTVAVNLAAELAALDVATLLVDADTWGPSVAQALGLLDESAGLAAAVRAATNGVLDDVALARLCAEVEPCLRVLTGVSRPDRWRELAPTALDVVWAVARRLAAWTVVDCGAPIEEDVGAGFEAMLGPRRNGATLSVLAAADVVLVVGAGEPIGVQRLVHALTDLDEAALVLPAARRVVVVTKVRAAAAGPAPEAAVREALTRYAGVRELLVVPDDRPGTDRAMLAGATLRQEAPESPARAVLADLAAELAGRPADQRRPGRRAARRRGAHR